MNKNLDDLLQKYFAGETSLSEEKAIKDAFASGNYKAGHERYLPLFQTFEKEKSVKAPGLKPKKAGYPLFRNRWFYVVSSVAACLLLIMAVRYYQSSDDYLVINGKRINDPERARAFANAKLEKSLGVVKRNLAVYSDNEEVRQKLEEIENHLK